MITSDKDGKAEVTFFSSDDSGYYEINVEGVGLTGGIGRATNSFVVEPGKLSSLK